MIHNKLSRGGHQTSNTAHILDAGHLPVKECTAIRAQAWWWNSRDGFDKIRVGFRVIFEERKRMQRNGMRTTMILVLILVGAATTAVAQGGDAPGGGAQGGGGGGRGS